MPLVVTLHSHRLVYVATPKVASTTLLQSLLALANYEGDMSNPQRIFYRCQEAPLRSCGIERCEVDRDGLLGLHRRYRDYRWIAARRDPLRRVESNYFNKINRLAKRGARSVYCYGKLKQALAGPTKWNNINSANSAIRRVIDPQRFLHILSSVGIGFDVHYQLQCEQILSRVFEYDLVLALESMDRDYERLRELLDVERGSMPALTTKNKSSGDERIEWTPESLEEIERLYLQDFCQLGYALPTSRQRSAA